MRAGLLLIGAALAAGVVLGGRRLMAERNVSAFLGLIRQAESGSDYTIIAGGDHLSDFAEHPFIVNPNRRKPLGTTAAGAYQMVRPTWIMARDALGLEDFSPASQDAAARWLITFKVPGQNIIKPEGTGNLELIESGKFWDAVDALRPEWESFDKIARGRYFMTLAQAAELYTAQGGQIAEA